jgi:hypothetical protein
MFEAVHVILESFTQKIKDVLSRTKKLDDDHVALQADLESQGGAGLSREDLKTFEKDALDLVKALQAAAEELNTQNRKKTN